MGVFIKLDRYKELYGLEYYHRDWLNYSLGGGYGNVYKERRQLGMASDLGKITNKVLDPHAARFLHRSLSNFRDHKWDKFTSFYGSVLVFCGEQIKKHIKYEHFEQNKLKVKIKKCLESAIFPDWAEEKLEEVWSMDKNFYEYLDFLLDVPGLNFDVETAKTVYALQGDRAIFGILAQIYTTYHQFQKINIKLIPNVPIINTPNVSDFVSGVFFPVVATKFSNNFHWEENDEGCFLIDEFDCAIDCVRSGTYSCGSDPLFNRLGFVYRSGYVGNPWRVCWNWGELVEAVHYFDGDVLVRGLSESILRSDWRRFGPNGLVTVYGWNGMIAGKTFKWKRPKETKFIESVKVDVDKKEILCIDLMGKKRKREPEGPVVYTNDEIEDWLELGRLCST